MHDAVGMRERDSVADAQKGGKPVVDVWGFLKNANVIS